MKSFEKYHPFSLFLFFTQFVLATVIMSNPFISVISWVAALFLYKQYCKFSDIIKSILFGLVFVAVMMIVNALVYHGGVTILFFLNDKQITLEAAYYGMNMGLMMAAVLQWSMCYFKIMTNDRILYLFGRVSPNIALILSMSFRFIPLYLGKYRETYVTACVNKMGHLKKQELGYIERMYLALQSFSIVLTWAFENSMDTVYSMKARGYTGIGRKPIKIFRVKIRDIILSIVIVVMIIYSGIVSFNESIKIYFYPNITIPEFGVEQGIFYLAFALTAMLPTFIEIEEKIKWNYYMLKV